MLKTVRQSHDHWFRMSRLRVLILVFSVSVLMQFCGEGPTRPRRLSPNSSAQSAPSSNLFDVDHITATLSTGQNQEFHPTLVAAVNEFAQAVNVFNTMYAEQAQNNQPITSCETCTDFKTSEAHFANVEISELSRAFTRNVNRCAHKHAEGSDEHSICLAEEVIRELLNWFVLNQIEVIKKIRKNPVTVSSQASATSNQSSSTSSGSATPRAPGIPEDVSVLFNCCSFPLAEYPVPAYPKRYDDGSFRSYGWTRLGGSQFHGATDIWGNIGDPVYAIADGEVLDIYAFFSKTDYSIDVLHPQECLIVRYAELVPNVKVGDKIKQGQKVGEIANLGLGYQMVHFETFGDCKNTKGYLTDRSRPEKRRADIFDPTKMVQEWEKNKPDK